MDTWSIEEFLNDEEKRNSHKKHLKDVDNIVAISKKTRESIEEVFQNIEASYVQFITAIILKR